MGIDRAGFGQTAFFRSDFATESLNGLLNRLASTPDAVLVDQTTWERFNLEVGSTMDIRVTINQTEFPTSFTVAGVFSRFPTWPGETQGSLFVTNLDYLFELVGGPELHDIWLEIEPDADRGAMQAQIEAMKVYIREWREAREELATAFAQPERVGTLGTLTIPANFRSSASRKF